MSKFSIFFTTALAAVLIVILGHYFFIYSSSDDIWYIKIAQGDIKDVLQPFSGRLLHPLTVYLISFFSGFDVSVSFWILSVFLLFGFVFMLSLFFSEISFMNAALAFILVFAPFMLDYFRYFYFADLFMFFFAILFFYFLKKNNFIFSLLLLFLLLFTRPREAFILGIILVIVSFYKSNLKLSGAALLTTITGFFIDYQINLIGKASVHHLNGFIYYILSPIYWLGRFLGIDWLTNTMVQYCQPYFIYSFPDWLNLGSIKWVGICQFNIIHPFFVIFNSFIIFGFIPLILAFLLYKNWRHIFKENQIWVLTALVYGIVMFFLGSWLGTLRTIGYSWPVFLLATPFIFDQWFRQWPDSAKAKLTRAFFYLNPLVMWAPYLIIKNFSFISDTFKYILAYLMVFVFYFLFFKIYAKIVSQYRLSGIFYAK